MSPVPPGGPVRAVPPGGPVRALRATFRAPVASFRDPLFPGLTRILPVPPPSTVRGMLAAATGAYTEPFVFGMAAWADGHGIDTETYHPIAADGSNPAAGGRVRAGKGGATAKDRPFLADVHLTLWLPEPESGLEGSRFARALRRPRHALRLGRSQDLVHLTGLAEVLLEPAERAVVGHALAPADGHGVRSAHTHRLADTVSTDRLTTTWSDYLWCDEAAGAAPVRGAYREAPTGNDHPHKDTQAVWLLTP
ncbi:CRISPR-associated protein Cas5 [Kitasatospora sp. NPDC058444]|uniref:CRISPR-associated protein Cas5 n=1 Tax=Kitasatospora sp. NPDC058444 TaxID=3346504 RepID=UPI00364C76A4